LAYGHDSVKIPKLNTDDKNHIPLQKFDCSSPVTDQHVGQSLGHFSAAAEKCALNMEIPIY
jgi:hypothetical protein